MHRRREHLKAHTGIGANKNNEQSPHADRYLIRVREADRVDLFCHGRIRRQLVAVSPGAQTHRH